jgi:hypothetical protein
MSPVTRLRRSVLTVLVWLLVWGGLPAQSPSADAEAAFQQGVQSLATNREAQALVAFHQAAELGHPQAMFQYVP